MKEYRQWAILFKQKNANQKSSVIGCGWRSYEGAPDFYTTLSLKAMLSNSPVSLG
jgi:hypothetical protein